MRVVLIAAIIGVAAGQEVSSITQQDKNCSADPLTVRLCYPLPPGNQPDPNIIFVIAQHLHDVFYWYNVYKKTEAAAAAGDQSAQRSLEEIPQSWRSMAKRYTQAKLAKEARDLKIAGQPKPIWKEYYWQSSCRYSLNRLFGFLHVEYGWCWVDWPWHFQNNIFAKCTSTYCTSRCMYLDHLQRNRVCLESNYFNTNLYMYCPFMHKERPNPCWNQPWRCKLWVKARLPACCNCFICRRRRIYTWLSAADQLQLPRMDMEQDGYGSNADGAASMDATYGRSSDMSGSSDYDYNDDGNY